MKDQHTSPLPVFAGRVRLAQVRPLVGMSSATIYRRIADGTFPRPVRLSSRCSLFDAAELNSWLADPASYRADNSPDDSAAPVAPAVEAAATAKPHPFGGAA